MRIGQMSIVLVSSKENNNTPGSHSISQKGVLLLHKAPEGDKIHGGYAV